MSKLLNAIGLMSGTSLDGIDVALVRTDGEAVVERGPARTYPYSEAQRRLLKDAIAEAKTLTGRNARSGCLALAERELTDWHALAVASFLKDCRLTSSEIDVIGFHGQTVIHRPEIRLTVQLGDGPGLARRLGRPVVYDMRAGDVAAGGQGAPLVPVYHQALATSLRLRPVAFVNIGGVANVTWIGDDDSLLAFDTGPGNALLDDWMLKHTGKARDDNGALAAQGQVDHGVLAQFAGDSFFEQSPPKSLDRNSFAAMNIDVLAPADGAATLTAFTAHSVAMSRAWFPQAPELWVICGGGRHNLTLLGQIRCLLDNVLTAEQAGFDGNAMEAEAWGHLAVRSLKGLPLTFPGTTGVPQPLTGGVLAIPSA